MQSSPLFDRTRLKLASAYAGVMSCILGVCGCALYQVVVHDYRESIDQGLESVAWAIHNSIEPLLDQRGDWQQVVSQLSLTLCSSDKPCLGQTPNVVPIATAASPVNYYLRLLNAKGQLIALGGISLETVPLTPGENYLKTITGTSGFGMRFRQISLPLDSQKHRWGYVQVGRSLQDLDHHLESLRLALLLGLPILIGLVSWSSWWLAGLAMQPVYASYRQMQQFTSDAAHEFKTPLTAMRSTIEAIQQTHLQQGYPPAHPLREVAKVLEVLQRQSIRLSQLVNDLLLLAKLERQECADYSQLCNLSEIINDLIEELAFVAIQSQVMLSLTPAESEQPDLQDNVLSAFIILGNEDQLYRLFSNLIVNAIQATPQGGAVTVTLRCTKQKAVIQVIDTGIGIPPNDLANLFDRFYRVHSDRSRDTGGSGLGLAIAHAIVVAHRGTINVHSQPGQGSRFIICLPLD